MVFQKKFIAFVAVTAILAGAFFVFRGDEGAAVARIAPAAGSPAQPAAADGQKKPVNAWNVRCGEKKEGDAAPAHCEIFQRLVSKDSGERVTEFAIGYPEGFGAGKDARGVVILPLGVVVEDGMEMQIDDGGKFKFRVRYCTAKGCFAFLSLNGDLLAAFTGGKEARITGKAFTGQDMSIRLSLDGFDKALEKIQQGS